MGYTTEFEGEISIDPPLSADEWDYLKRFAHTRRMWRGEGPYFVRGSGLRGQGDDPDIIAPNDPGPLQPGLWNQWVPNDEGTALIWDSGRGFYDSPEWMLFLIDHFLKPGAYAVGKVPGIVGGHVLNGEIEAQGDDENDKWTLVVKDNEVFLRGLDGSVLKVEPRNFTVNAWCMPALRKHYFPWLDEKFRVANVHFEDQDVDKPIRVDATMGGDAGFVTFTKDETGKWHRGGVMEWSPEE